MFYENPSQWSYVKSDRKIFCTVRGCNFSTKLEDGCLAEHAEKMHAWGSFPCKFNDCKYESYSQKSYQRRVFGKDNKLTCLSLRQK
jgi:hypothetical protein